jgi:hypothetical protein
MLWKIFYISIIRNIFISFRHVRKNSEPDCACIVWWNCLKRIRFVDARFCVHDSDAGTQHAVSHGCGTVVVSRIALSLTILVLYSWRSSALLCLLFRRNFLHKSRPGVWEQQITSFQYTCWSIVGAVFFLSVVKSVKLEQTRAGACLLHEHYFVRDLKEVIDKVVTLHAMKAYWDSGVKLPLFFCIRWR